MRFVCIFYLVFGKMFVCQNPFRSFVQFVVVDGAMAMYNENGFAAAQAPCP